jgi:hypothetical protein
VRRAALLLALAAAGCATVDRVAPTSDAAPAVPATAYASPASEGVISYLARIKSMNEAALAAEAARMKREPGDAARVKAALALSLAPQSDEGDILALVDAVRKENTDREVTAMASFLHSLALERRRLKESAAAAGVKLREEKRTSDMQKQRADSLQQKLDALTELEKSLSDRPMTSR